MIIAVDFDGTCVKHRFPYVGESIGAECVLKMLVNNGHKLILNTMRSHPKEGAIDERLKKEQLSPASNDTLQDAIDWFKQLGIELFGINENPTQHSWTESPKCYAHLYIDDAGLGVPLKEDIEGNFFVDWIEVAKYLHNIGCLTSKQMDDAIAIIEKISM